MLLGGKTKTKQQQNNTPNSLPLLASLFPIAVMPGQIVLNYNSLKQKMKMGDWGHTDIFRKQQGNSGTCWRPHPMSQPTSATKNPVTLAKGGEDFLLQWLLLRLKESFLLGSLVLHLGGTTENAAASSWLQLTPPVHSLRTEDWELSPFQTLLIWSTWFHPVGISSLVKYQLKP